MTTLPTISTDPDEALRPATRDQRDTALWVLFSQFHSSDGDAEGKRVGYDIALADKPLWAIERAVKRFVAHEVSSHDGRFLPTSAELCRVVQEEMAFAVRMRDRQLRDRHTTIEDKRISTGDERDAALARNADRLAALGVDTKRLGFGEPKPLPEDRIASHREDEPDSRPSLRDDLDETPF